MEKMTMKEPPIDFKKLRRGEEVECPECKKGIFRTSEPNSQTAHHFECDKCGLSINFD